MTVIYARYSSDSQTEQSIEGQVRVCKQFAEKNDLLVVDSYIDRAATGTNDNRAAFQQMLRDSKKAQWGAVIVYKLDRFARNKYESVVNRKKLKDNGVELVSAMENIPDTPEGKLFLAVIEGFNEYFSEDLKQKVNRGLRESWLKGNATGGHPPYGYVIKDKKYVIDEAEAAIVREIFMKYAQGYKAVAIAEDLKARNVRRKCSKYINHKYVYVILHDKRYIGIVEHQGTTYYNIFPPIITKELWNQVDAINQENKIAPSRKKGDLRLHTFGKAHLRKLQTPHERRKRHIAKRRDTLLLRLSFQAAREGGLRLQSRQKARVRRLCHRRYRLYAATEQHHHENCGNHCKSA